ncbi:hypothetical protein DPMN_097638 [Dreissena polymorpha]|uniref:Uncharacterized protein n=1 Tax=Dreissena polymorpha TaxID=45954 RepID=A0A9D4LC55_DREPO|nr:hypothetical protein DPMN_097638 [Dreissena polymorpha]
MFLPVGTGVVTASLHPGAVATELLRYINEYNICIRIPVLIFYHAFFKFFCKTPTAGAQTSLHCALAPEVERQSGKYFRYSLRIFLRVVEVTYRRIS